MSKVNIYFKKFNDNAVIPTLATEGSAGFDLTCVSRSYDEHSKTWKCKTGIGVEIPKGYVGLLFSRSSICKKDLILSNCVGVIDSDYRGEITAVFREVNDGFHIYEIGERCCQLVIVPYLNNINFIELDNLSDTNRGDGGYGSTGK